MADNRGHLAHYRERLSEAHICKDEAEIYFC